MQRLKPELDFKLRAILTAVLVLAAVVPSSGQARVEFPTEYSALHALERWRQSRHQAVPPPRVLQERFREMRLLMEHNPSEFLRRSLTTEERAALPAALSSWLERRVKGRGSFGVFCALRSQEKGPHDDPHHSYEYAVVLNGVPYKAFVSEKWKNQTSVREAAIEGVVLGDAIALGDALTPDEQIVAGQPVVAEAPTLTGPNTLLYIIARFSDENAAPISETDALNQMDVVSTFWLNNSAGMVFLRGRLNPAEVMDTVQVTLPRPTSYGASYNVNFAQLLGDARAAAAAQGYNYADYNLDVVVTSDQNFAYAGKGNVGSQGCHLVTPTTTLRTAGHELGHNLGLFHAAYWRTDSTKPFGKDSVPGGYVADSNNAEWVEYGHYFSLMSAQSGWEIEDPGKPHYAPAEKVRLGWLSGSAVRYVNASSTNRIYRHDHRDTTGVPRALRVEVSASDYTGLGRRYWLSYRFAPWSSASDWFRNGLQVEVARTTYGSDGAVLLDMTPYSRDSALPFFDPNHKPSGWWMLDNGDKSDGALLLGRTYSDTAAGIHITPIASGSLGLNEEYIDVVLHIGSFPSNRAPIINAFQSSSLEATPGELINLNVVAQDLDGDALAYSWHFDAPDVFSSSGLNTSSAVRSWGIQGEYRVTIAVSDMKGGVATESLVVTIGAPSYRRRAYGRVVWAGRPVYGARVSANRDNTTLQAWTDTDGTYVLTDLTVGPYVLNCSAEGLTFNPQFANPVSIGENHVYARDFYANEPLPLPSAISTYTIAGQVTYAGVGVSGVEVRAGGQIAISNGEGLYEFTNFPSGSYTVAAVKENWSFSPATRAVTLNSSGSSGQNFSRVAPHSISGRIDGLPTGAFDPSPSVYLSNGRWVEATRAGSGQNRYWSYTLSAVPTGQYSVVADLWGYRITPSSFTNQVIVAGTRTSMNFTGASAQVVGTASGRVTERGWPISGVVIEARLQGLVESAVTDSDGFFIVPNLGDNAYTLVPARPGYTFSPAFLSGVLAGSTRNHFSASGPGSAPGITSIAATPPVVANVNSTASLSSAATGIAPLSYRWDAILSPGPVTFTENDTASASSTTVSFRQPGRYAFRLRVTDSNSITATSLVSVIVSAAPGAMVVTPYETAVSQGAAVMFRADAWDLLGHRLDVTPTWYISGGGGIAATGLFSAATVGGPYIVTATSPPLSATGFVWVVPAPIVPPSILDHPQGQLVNIGANTTFTASATGTPPLSYQWFHNATNPVPMATNCSLILTNVQDADAGVYSVTVSNAASSQTSSNAVLQVNHLPVPSAPILRRYPNSSAKVSIRALLGSDPDGDELFLSDILTATTVGATISTNAGWVLYVPPGGLIIDDAFTYTVADGRGGFSAGSATVLVVTNPGPSLNLTWRSIGSGAVHLVGDGIPDRTYTIEFTGEINSPSWQSLGTVTADAFGRFEYLHTVAQPAAATFYRVLTY